MKFRLHKTSDSWLGYTKPFWDKAKEYTWVEDSCITSSDSGFHGLPANIKAPKEWSEYKSWAEKGYYDFYLQAITDGVSLRAKHKQNIFFVDLANLEDLKEVGESLGELIVSFEKRKHVESGIDYDGEIEVYDDYRE